MEVDDNSVMIIQGDVLAYYTAHKNQMSQTAFAEKLLTDTKLSLVKLPNDDDNINSEFERAKDLVRNRFLYFLKKWNKLRKWGTGTLMPQEVFLDLSVSCF